MENTQFTIFSAEIRDIQKQIEMKQTKTMIKGLKNTTEKVIWTGAINEYLGINSGYNEKLYIEEDELVYIGGKVTNQEENWLKKLGIRKMNTTQ